MSYLNKHNPQIPTQQEPLDERQVLNAAGGYVYEISEWDALMRFLVLGTQGGSIYESEKDLTKQNLDNVIKAITSDGVRVVEMVLDVSDSGKARKNDMALFTLALCMKHGDAETKKAVERVYNSVARTGTHHLMFCNFIENMPGRGWGRAVKRIVAGWYTSKEDEALAYQVVKYRNREGFSHQKALHRCHGGMNTPLYRWIAGRYNGVRDIKRGLGDAEVVTHYAQVLPQTEPGQNLPKTLSGTVLSVYPKFLEGFLCAQELADTEVDNQHTKRLVSLIGEYGLTHEMVPNAYLKQADVWVALLQNMPITATLRNLGRMTSLGLLDPFSENLQTVLDKFTPESVKKARLHPLATLIGLKTYESGKGVKGSLEWAPNQKVLAHLDDVFYWGFETIEPTGKNIMLALDCSGSMFSNWSTPFANCPSLMCSEIAGVMAMVTARTEQNYHITGFGTAIRPLHITNRSSLKEVMTVLRNDTYSGTDCAIPIVHALQSEWNSIDGFAIYTDNDTWAGRIHPKTALEQYRNKTGRDTRLVSVSMIANDTTIADGSVPWMIDFVGMSTDTPRQVGMYLKGEI